MKKFILKLWNGNHRIERTFEANDYEHARWLCGVDGYPPGYIWSIEPVLVLGTNMTTIPLCEKGPVNVHPFSWRGSRY
jgi:hypothetical protein